MVMFMGTATVFAFDPANTGLVKTGETADYNTAQTDVSGLAGNIISGFLALIGLVLLILVIYGGITWMLAGGDAAKVTKAKDYITNAIIGIIIIGLAYAISNYVIDALIQAQKIS